MSLVVDDLEQDWEALGRAIEEARGRRSQSEVAKAVGVSPTTLAEIEKGRRPNARSSTLRVIEEFLGWERGTVGRILSGELTETHTPGVKQELNEVRQILDSVVERQNAVEDKLDRVLSLLRQLPGDH